MNFAEIAFKNRTTTLVLTFCASVGGILAYQNLGRLEDPEFTIKDAIITTPYPGASAQEVEEEVTDRIEVEHEAFACMLGGPDGKTLFICTAPDSHPDKTGNRGGRIEYLRVDVPGAGLP